MSHNMNRDDVLKDKPTLQNVTGIVLAGGQSRRMHGIDKGLLLIDQQPMALRVINSLRHQTTKQLVVCQSRQRAHYAKLCDHVLTDQQFAGSGPLAGLLAARDHLTTPYFAVAACDLPQLSDYWVSTLLTPLLATGATLAVAHTEGTQRNALLGVGHRSTLEGLEALIGRGHLRWHDWITAQSKVIRIPLPDHELLNVNRSSDLVSKDLSV